MWRPRATPHVGTGNDLQVAHDISFSVVTKIQYFWGNRPAKRTIFGQLEGYDRNLLTLKRPSAPSVLYSGRPCLFTIHPSQDFQVVGHERAGGS
jgi:hypothetical protein